MHLRRNSEHPGSIRAVHHIALKSKQPAELAQFYKDILGLQETTRHTDPNGLRSVWLQLENAILMIERSVTDREAPVILFDDPPGLHMLAYSITPHERPNWKTWLVSHGCPIRRETAYTLYCADPEGHLFGLSHWPNRYECT
ncbi:MAG: VOC family protein [Myxococcales bacterium]|nr:VOC family protein [Myxococcales bacterium]